MIIILINRSASHPRFSVADVNRFFVSPRQGRGKSDIVGRDGERTTRNENEKFRWPLSVGVPQGMAGVTRPRRACNSTSLFSRTVRARHEWLSRSRKRFLTVPS
jgi:hypothetical protein